LRLYVSLDTIFDRADFTQADPVPWGAKSHCLGDYQSYLVYDGIVIKYRNNNTLLTPEQAAEILAAIG